MDEERKAEILREAYRNIEMKIEPHVPRSLTWTPRQAEPKLEVRRPRTSTPDGVDAYQRIDHVWQHHQKYVAATEGALNALADEAGAETGKLQRQINELRTQVEEMRGELALLRCSRSGRGRRAFFAQAERMMNSSPSTKADEAAFKAASDIVAIANAMQAAMAGDPCEVACGLVVISKLLVGTEIAARAALARVMLKAVRDLVDVTNDSP
jgi:hypothetical protein